MLINCSEDPLHSANGSDGMIKQEISCSNSKYCRRAYQKNYQTSDEDLLYIKGSYDDENGTQKQVIVSSFIDTLGITGFGQVGQYPVEIRAVDIGDNESEPVIVEISPLESPIHAILESIDGIEDFGGINISYLNPTRAEANASIVCSKF